MNNDKQHLEDTKYVQWQDGMYVMIDDLDGDYELAVVEDSLRGSSWEDCNYRLLSPIKALKNCVGVYETSAGTWMKGLLFKTKLTRAQALYIATGDVSI
jgi:hypothetical protein